MFHEDVIDFQLHPVDLVIKFADHIAKVLVDFFLLTVEVRLYVA